MAHDASVVIKYILSKVNNSREVAADFEGYQNG